ncbi:MAG: nucleotidyltransferase domain-containing protein [Burkholderiales bacterium]
MNTASPGPDGTIRALLAGVLDAHPEIRLALLFGSLARGRAHWESDLDLAVDAGRPLTPDEHISLIEELGQALGRPVDLIDLYRAGPGLLGEILRSGARVKGTSADQARWAVRYVLDAEDFLPGLRELLAARRKRWIGG